MNRLCYATLLIISFHASFGQIIIQGRILNKETKEPISYANIGIANSNVGTLSNLDGSFLIPVPGKFSQDTLIFSALGFTKRAIPIQYIRQHKALTVLLFEKSTVLNSVVISGKRQSNKTFELGNRSFQGGVIVTDTTYAGRAMSLLIENKQPYLQKDLKFPVYLEKARLRIFKNNLASLKFRLRINDVDSLTGKPGNDLLSQSIVVESTIRKGWLEFDLSHLYFQVSKQFFLTFEQILDLKDRTSIADGYRDFISEYPEKIKFDTVEIEGKKEVRKIIKGSGLDLPGTFIAIAVSKTASDYYTSFVRETSLGEWVKVRGIVTATVSLSNQTGTNTKHTKKETNLICEDNLAVCQANQLCKDFMEEHGLNGVQVSVCKENKIIWSGAFGYADSENKIPVSDSTRFRINSVSKPMTSIALIKLFSEGKLDLDAPIQKYVSTFPIKNYPITTRQLAGHLAGIRDYKGADLQDFIRTEHFENATQAIAIFKDDSLLFKPGTKFHYSTFGWNLIGAVIEGISKESYLDYMKNNIWKPLGLLNTCGDNNSLSIPNRSKFYDLTGQVNDLGDWSYKYSGGGLLSTSKDLVKFGNKILNDKYLDSKAKTILFESQTTLDNEKTGYGLGWYVGLDKNNHKIWYHSGDSFSSSSHLIIYPDDNLVIAFLANSQHGAAFDIQHIGELFYTRMDK
jgi:CubicO group peptidase (beta-lactamase class C family)